jgi:DNA-binding NtrC family response regulator
MTPPPLVVGKSARIREVREFIRIVAGSDSPVLITGESGTGKELVAAQMHQSSRRCHEPFVAIGCDALADTGGERELIAAFARAGGGTVFLDDVDRLPIALQVRLGPLLHGASRVMSASTRELRKLVAAGVFREDLYYRLNIIPIQMPPLRDRTEDIPLLVKHFLAKYSQAAGASKPLSPAMLETFRHYPWPGNVRELEAACERMAQTCICDAIVAGCVPPTILFHRPDAVAAPEPPAAARADLDGESLDRRLAALETDLIAAALHTSRGNKSKAAMLLKIKRSTLGDRMRKLGLTNDITHA